MKKIIIVETYFAASRDAVFELAASRPEIISHIFPGMPPLIPSVTGASLDSDGPCRAGMYRTINLGDGSSIKEIILDYDVPRRHHYRVHEMTDGQKKIFNQLESDWSFEESGNGCKVKWVYTVGFKSPLLFPLAIVLQWAMGKCMRNCHNILKADLERVA